jgi:hypothetical protein
MYLFSKSILSLLVSGIIKFPNTNDIIAKKIAETINGLISLVKLIPLLRIAIISLLLAILEVKYITEIKIKSGLKRLAK